MNISDYKYIDSSRLVWYVSGTSSDGNYYVLTRSDLELEEFMNSPYIPLYDNLTNRTGLTFRFDDQGVSGNWNVWCEYKYFEASETIKSQVHKISTGAQYHITTIIGIVLGVCGASILIVLIFALRKARKDRVY